MPEICVPAYLKKTEYCDKGDKCKNLVDYDKRDNLKFKCDSFCKKFEKEIIFDINISDQKIKDQKIQEIGLIAQEKFRSTKFYKFTNYFIINRFCLKKDIFIPDLTGIRQHK
jgi:hypothetical protein